MYMALVQHHFIYSYSPSAAPFPGAYAAPFHTALLQHRFTWRLYSTISVSRGAYAAPLSLINYLINKMNNFTSSRPTLWLKSSRNCSGGWRGLVGGFSYYIKIFYQIYCIKIYEKGENLKVRSTEEYWCQFGFIHWPFFRGRRQGRQPLNKIW